MSDRPSCVGQLTYKYKCSLAVWIGKRRAEKIEIPGEAIIDVTLTGE